MGRALSLDLRERAMAAVDGGMSCRAAAARFGVGVSSAIRWRQQQLIQGHVQPGRPGGNVRVIGSIDDGGWRAFVPLSDSFIKAADGRFVGE